MGFSGLHGGLDQRLLKIRKGAFRNASVFAVSPIYGNLALNFNGPIKASGDNVPSDVPFTFIKPTLGHSN